MAIKIQGDTVIFDDKVFQDSEGTTAATHAITASINGMIVNDKDCEKFFIQNIGRNRLIHLPISKENNQI